MVIEEFSSKSELPLEFRFKIEFKGVLEKYICVQLL